MKACTSATLALAAALFATGPASAHDGDHPPDMRVWKDADGLFEIEGSFEDAVDAVFSAAVIEKMFAPNDIPALFP